MYYIQSVFNLINLWNKEIDLEISNHTKRIKNTFKEFHELLDKRKNILLIKLNKIGNNKKNELEKKKKLLKDKHEFAKQVKVFIWIV